MSRERFLQLVRALLQYSWEDVGFDYEQLTPAERALMSQSEFVELRRIADGLAAPGENR